MSEKPSAPPIPPVPPGENKKEWEDKFFAKHEITDDGEKKAIRGRARVLAYRDAEREAEEEEKKSKPPDKAGDKKDKPWWKE